MVYQYKHQIHDAYKDEPHPALEYELPPNLRKIRTGLLVLVASVAIIIIYVLYWAGVAYYYHNALDGWVKEQRDQGIQVGYDDYRLSGFPFYFYINLSNPSIAALSAERPWSWQGESVTVESSPWSPMTLAAKVPGMHSLDFADQRGITAYFGVIGELTVTFQLGEIWPPQGTVRVRDVDMLGGGGRLQAQRVDLSIESLNGPDAGNQTPTVKFSFNTEKVTAPAALALPLGDFITQASIDGTIVGYIEAEPMPDALVKWRDAGGAVQISRLGVIYGPLNLLTGGTMALDGELQPIGAFTAKAKGFFAAIMGLRKAGVISGKAAVTATVVLGAMARKPKDGGALSINLALTIQDRKIYAGPVVLAQVPAITWPKTKPVPEAKK